MHAEKHALSKVRKVAVTNMYNYDDLRPCVQPKSPDCRDASAFFFVNAPLSANDKLDEFGIHENFFYLGIRSLHVAQVVSRVRDTSKLDLPLRALFEAPIIEGLA